MFVAGYHIGSQSYKDTYTAPSHSVYNIELPEGYIARIDFTRLDYPEQECFLAECSCDAYVSFQQASIKYICMILPPSILFTGRNTIIDPRFSFINHFVDTNFPDQSCIESHKHHRLPPSNSKPIKSLERMQNNHGRKNDNRDNSFKPQLSRFQLDYTLSPPDPSGRITYSILLDYFEIGKINRLLFYFSIVHKVEVTDESSAVPLRKLCGSSDDPPVVYSSSNHASVQHIASESAETGDMFSALISSVYSGKLAFSRYLVSKLDTDTIQYRGNAR